METTKKFEVGKYYRNGDTILAIRGIVNTTHWGETFVVEFPDQWRGLRPVPVQNHSANNWVEITEQEWSTEISRE